jgi:hypothetical protein
LPTPSVAEKAATLLIAIGKEFPKPGTPVLIPHRELVAMQGSKWMGIASAASHGELAYLLNDFLEAEGFVTEKPPNSNAFTITP